MAERREREVPEAIEDVRIAKKREEGAMVIQVLREKRTGRYNFGWGVCRRGTGRREGG